MQKRMVLFFNYFSGHSGENFGVLCHNLAFYLNLGEIYLVFSSERQMLAVDFFE